MRRLLAKFRKSKDGLAAVEFAMLLPVMITLFFGVVELSLALACRADVTNVASAAADLVAQEQTVSTSDMTNVFNAAIAILYPYDSSKTTAQVTITSIIYDTSTKSLTSGKVDWSCTRGGTVRSGTVNLPSGLMNASGSVIMAEINYYYKSPTTQIVTGTKTMSNVFYTKPRRVAQITGPGTCPTF